MSGDHFRAQAAGESATRTLVGEAGVEPRCGLLTGWPDSSVTCTVIPRVAREPVEETEPSLSITRSWTITAALAGGGCMRRRAASGRMKKLSNRLTLDSCV